MRRFKRRVAADVAERSDYLSQSSFWKEVLENLFKKREVLVARHIPEDARGISPAATKVAASDGAFSVLDDYFEGWVDRFFRTPDALSWILGLPSGWVTEGDVGVFSDDLTSTIHWVLMDSLTDWFLDVLESKQS